MGSSARAASPSKARKAHTVGAVQASADYVVISSADDNLTIRQAQRLVHGHGLTFGRARIIADLCWGASGHA
jgi:hypothetical protein